MRVLRNNIRDGECSDIVTFLLLLAIPLSVLNIEIPSLTLIALQAEEI